eukprot:scaffold80576_cov30-Tisochrysis_lutea.AAC.1
MRQLKGVSRSVSSECKTCHSTAVEAVAPPRATKTRNTKPVLLQLRDCARRQPLVRTAELMLPLAMHQSLPVLAVRISRFSASVAWIVRWANRCAWRRRGVRCGSKPVKILLAFGWQMAAAAGGALLCIRRSLSSRWPPVASERANKGAHHCRDRILRRAAPGRRRHRTSYRGRGEASVLERGGGADRGQKPRLESLFSYMVRGQNPREQSQGLAVQSSVVSLRERAHTRHPD